MLEPVPRIRLPIQRRGLDVNVLELRVVVDVSDGRRVARLAVLDGHGLEEGRRDEVHVLAGIGENTHHGERREGAHGAAVVVARDPADRVVELRWDVPVRALGRQARAPCVVVQEDVEEGLLVADVA